jgi:O-antigen ligase
MIHTTGAWRSRAGVVAEPLVADAPPVVASGRTRRRGTTSEALEGNIWLVVLFFAAHIPLALAMERLPAVATTHAYAILAIGAWLAVTSKSPQQVAMVLAYITGAEVLWRMTGAQVYWEFGKYAGSAIALLALLRHKWLKPPLLAFAYFVFLLPSVMLTLANQDLSGARDQISFNLSGPFAILMCAWFFAHLQLTVKDLRSVFTAAIGPAIGVATLAAAGTFSSGDVVFYDSSNMISSGGFGPNQVSAILGLGALLALFVAFDRNMKRSVQAVLCAVVVGLAAQSALTFSRGGMYGAAGGAAVAACFSMKDARLRSRLVPLLVVIFIVGNYFVYPYLDGFTGGALSVRFQDTGLTGRDRLIRGDIELWKENPIFGVGPGQGRVQRGTYFLNSGGTTSAAASQREMSAHTEFSRLLSEHGVFGLAALLLLVFGAVINVRRAGTPRMRALIAGLAAWSALFMVSNAMRILAPSFVFGIGFAMLFEEGTAGVVGAGLFRLKRQPGSMRPLAAGHPARRNPGPGDQVG